MWGFDAGAAGRMASGLARRIRGSPYCGTETCLEHLASRVKYGGGQEPVEPRAWRCWPPCVSHSLCTSIKPSRLYPEFPEKSRLICIKMRKSDDDARCSGIVSTALLHAMPDDPYPYAPHVLTHDQPSQKKDRHPSIHLPNPLKKRNPIPSLPEKDINTTSRKNATLPHEATDPDAPHNTQPRTPPTPRPSRPPSP